jgi:hypothetical protein
VTSKHHLPERVGAHAVALIAVWGVGLLYTWMLLNRAWVPHDEGALGQSALRVLQGDLPHRDFVEIYTGGLSYLNAFAFEIWGVRLVAMRYMAYLAFACWIPVVYYLASGWGPAMAAGITLAAIAWSYPNYPAAMPSWYTLYCLTGAVACLLHYVEVRRGVWLAAAGMLVGVACLFKIVGLYILAGALLFLVYLEQAFSSTAAEPSSARRIGWFSSLVIAALLGYALGVFLLIWPRLGAPEFVQFVLPSWAAIAFLLSRERRAIGVPDVRRFRTGASIFGPLLLGLALPVLGFYGYFVAHGAGRELLVGVLVTPFRRVASAALRPPPLGALVPTLLVALALGFAVRPSPSAQGSRLVPLALLLAVLFAAGGLPGLGQLGYLALSQAIPVIVLVSVLVLSRMREDSEVGCQRLALLAFMSAAYALVQYPFYNTTYFTYIAATVLLALAALVETAAARPRASLALLLLFFCCYAWVWLMPWQYRLHNDGAARHLPARTLLPGRADLRVSLPAYLQYTELTTVIRANARGGFIWAGPDCPEVYFLSGLANPTGTLFDFLDQQEGRSQRILSTLARDRVRLVVIKSDPQFSEPIEPSLADSLRVRYPHDSVIGHFTVRWN